MTTAVRVSMASGLQRIVGPILAEFYIGEAVARGEGATRVDDGQRIARRLRDLDQRLGDMHRADDDHALRRVRHLDEQRAGAAVDAHAFVVGNGAARRRDRRLVERQSADFSAGGVVAVDQRLVTAL